MILLVYLLDRLPFRLQHKTSQMAPQFFYFFSLKLRVIKKKMLLCPIFVKKFQKVKMAQKVTKMAKIEFFIKNSNSLITF